MHKHAKQMMEYAQDAMESNTPWERWHCREEGFHKWFNLLDHPSWLPSSEYRRRPRTILVNGYEVPEPVREAPPRGSLYFVANPVYRDFSGPAHWSGDSFEFEWIKRNLVHLTKEAAQAHGRAMCGIDPLKTEAV